MVRGSPSPHHPAASATHGSSPARRCTDPRLPSRPRAKVRCGLAEMNAYHLSAKAQPTPALRLAGFSPPRRAEPTTALVSTWWSLDWKEPRPSCLLSGLGSKPQSRE